MKPMLLLMVLMSVVVIRAEDDEFVAKPSAKTAVAATKADEDSELAREQLRKCYRCLGKGKQIVSVREDCGACGGTGYISEEAVVKDTVNGRYYWESSYRTTKTVQKKKPCPKCDHRGKIPVKKEVDCPKCKGSGYLTKSGKPAVIARSVESDPPGDDAVEPMSSGEQSGTMSLADRLRANRGKVGAAEIEVPNGTGWAEFNYKANGGRFTIRSKGTSFDTVWRPMSDYRVKACRDGVEMVGYKPHEIHIPETAEALESFDWNRPSAPVRAGEIVAFMNKEGRFLCVKVVQVKDRANGAREDSLYIEFRVY